MEYLERGTRRMQRRWDQQVEAVRAATVFAHNLDAYRRWTRKRDAADPDRRPRGLSGADLEAALMAMAAAGSDIVAVRTAPAHG